MLCRLLKRGSSLDLAIQQLSYVLLEVKPVVYIIVLVLFLAVGIVNSRIRDHSVKRVQHYS